MRVRRAALLWLLAWCGPLLLVVALVLALRADFPVPRDVNVLENTYPNIVFGALVPMLGALIATRLPRHPIGWLFLGCGLASALTMAVYAYAETGLHHGLPGTVVAAWVSEWIWGLGLTPLVTIGILLFPDGRPPGPRWRLLLAADLLGVLLVFCANGFHPGRLENHRAVANPVGLPLPRELFTVVGSIGFGLFFVGLLGAAVAVLVRWRRAGSELRSQLNWFAFAAATLAVAVLVPFPRVIGDVVMMVAIPLLPLSVAVAILRHRLYGIEVAVRRSLVYVGLTAVLLVAYALTVTALGAGLRGRAGQTGALVGTAVVAVAFAPVRQRVQRGVDRMLYGDRGDPYAVLTGLGRRLDAATTSDLLTEIAAAVGSSLRLPHVRVEVDRPDRAPMVATYGPPTNGLHTVPLSFRGDPVGRLMVAPRTALDPFRAADLRLLGDLGLQIGVAAAAAASAVALQESRQVLVTAREEERRRMRRDLHDGLGPALAGLALGLDALHRTAVDDPVRASALAEELRQEVQASLADVRRLVENLRPPALDQLGLVGAIRQHVDRINGRDFELDVSVEATDVPNLPAAVEVAAYRIATEALTNVARHADARHCRVGLCVSASGVLLVEVEDDGLGMPGRPRAGVGLVAMRERAAELGGTCATEQLPTGGTMVSAQLPMGSGDGATVRTLL